MILRFVSGSVTPASAPRGSARSASTVTSGMPSPSRKIARPLRARPPAAARGRRRCRSVDRRSPSVHDRAPPPRSRRRRRARRSRVDLSPPAPSDRVDRLLDEGLDGPGRRAQPQISRTKFRSSVSPPFGVEHLRVELHAPDPALRRGAMAAKGELSLGPSTSKPSGQAQHAVAVAHPDALGARCRRALRRADGSALDLQERAAVLAVVRLLDDAAAELMDEPAAAGRSRCRAPARRARARPGRRRGRSRLEHARRAARQDDAAWAPRPSDLVEGSWSADGSRSTRRFACARAISCVYCEPKSRIRMRSWWASRVIGGRPEEGTGVEGAGFRGVGVRGRRGYSIR